MHFAIPVIWLENNEKSKSLEKFGLSARALLDETHGFEALSMPEAQSTTPWSAAAQGSSVECSQRWDLSWRVGTVAATQATPSDSRLSILIGSWSNLKPKAPGECVCAWH